MENFGFNKNFVKKIIDITSRPDLFFAQAAWRRDLMPALAAAMKIEKQTHDPYHDFSHIQRVFSLAAIIFNQVIHQNKKYTKDEQEFWNILTVACFYHDIGRKHQVKKSKLGIAWDGILDVPRSIKTTSKVLYRLHYPPMFIGNVCLAIQGTNGLGILLKYHYTNQVAQILADADALELVSAARWDNGFQAAARRQVSKRYIDNMIQLNYKYNLPHVFEHLHYDVTRRMFLVLLGESMVLLKNKYPAYYDKYHNNLESCRAKVLNYFNHGK